MDTVKKNQSKEPDRREVLFRLASYLMQASISFMVLGFCIGMVIKEFNRDKLERGSTDVYFTLMGVIITFWFKQKWKTGVKAKKTIIADGQRTDPIMIEMEEGNRKEDSASEEDL